MFCKNCGKNIPVGKKKCPYCGMELGSMYSTSGIREIDKFMGGINQQPNQEQQSIQEQQPIIQGETRLQRQEEVGEKDRKSLKKLIWGMIIVVTLCIIANVVTISMVFKSIVLNNDAQEEIRTLTNHIEEMSDNVNKAEEVVQELSQDVMKERIRDFVQGDIPNSSGSNDSPSQENIGESNEANPEEVLGGADE